MVDYQDWLVYFLVNALMHICCISLLCSQNTGLRTGRLRMDNRGTSAWK